MGKGGAVDGGRGCGKKGGGTERGGCVERFFVG